MVYFNIALLVSLSLVCFIKSYYKLKVYTDTKRKGYIVIALILFMLGLYVCNFTIFEYKVYLEEQRQFERLGLEPWKF